eukprot:symbB.v1.2.001388.t1/scaffold67.1/size356791/14
MAGSYDYDPVGPREGCCVMFSRFFMVVFCMLAALMIATAVTLQMAPRHVDTARDWAATNYQNHLHDHVEGIGQHAQAAGAWAHDQYQHHLGGHFNTAGQWVADTYQEHASEHVNAAGNWVHGTYQQHLKPHLDPVHQWASNAYDEHLAHHVNKIHSYFTGKQHDQILNPYDCSGDWSSCDRVNMKSESRQMAATLMAGGAGLCLLATGVRAYLTRRPKGYRRPTWRALPEGDLLQQGFKSNKVPEDLDYIVIGSGMGGLWLAAALTKCGYKVMVLEQHYIAGGCCHAFNQNGVEFTPGIHYIGDIDMAKGLLGAVGDPEYQADWNQMGASEDGGLYDKAIFGDREPILLRQGRDAWYAEMCKHMPGKEKLLKDWLSAIDEAKKAFMPLMFAKAWHPWTQWFWLRLCCRAGLKWASKTVHEVIQELGGDAVDEALLTFQSMDHGETPRTASFPVHAMIVSHYMNGAWFPKGGPLSLARPLVSTIFKGGGGVFVRAPVQQIEVLDGRATGVRMKKKDLVLSCRRGVISAAGLDATLRLLKPQDVEQYLTAERDFMHSLGQGTSCLAAFVTVRGNAKELGLSDHNVWFFPQSPASNRTLDDLTATSRANVANATGDFFCFIGAGSLKDPQLMWKVTDVQRNTREPRSSWRSAFVRSC